MDFNQIRYFITLAETLNFTRAAELCFVSQSALTQAIKRLESDLGGELIKRDGRYNELTNLGKEIKGHFEQILITNELVRQTANRINDSENSEINIGIMCTVGPGVLAPAFSSFRLKNKNSNIVLHDVAYDSIMELLVSGVLDGVFCARHSDKNEALDYVPLFNEDMVVAFSSEHIFEELDQVKLIDITRQQYVDRLHCEFRKEYISFCRQKKVTPNIVFSSQREDWIQGVIKDGLGISIIPRFSLMEPSILHRKITDPELQRVVEFAYVRNKHLSPVVSAFIEAIREVDWEHRISEHLNQKN